VNGGICEHLLWDTDFFGTQIARLVPTTVNTAEIREAMGWAAKNRIDCLYFLCDANNPESVRLAERQGFRLVDIRVTKAITLAAGSRLTCVFDKNAIRPAAAEDIPVLKAIAGVSHNDSRFFFDQGFNRSRCAALYEYWIEKSCNGWADAVFVTCQDDQPVGYITCHRDRPDLGRIGLMAVASQAQGRGLGTSLVHAALGWFTEQHVLRVTVVTQGRNIGAQRLYERCGFVTIAVGLWYHGWAPFSVS